MSRPVNVFSEYSPTRFSVSTLGQGAGYVDGLAARNLIATGNASDDFPSLPNATKSVKVNLEQGTFLKVQDGQFLLMHKTSYQGRDKTYSIE